MNSAELLRLRVLVCFYKAGDEGCTVTGLSKTLDEEKYAVSRILVSMEKEGLLDRSDQRHPILTEKGYSQAREYSERLDITVNHLLYEGVDLESAKHDSLYWALYNSEKTMAVISSMEERYRVKYELQDRKNFTGATLCKQMQDGVYKLPFLIYREHVHNGTNISMANEGFEHPCVLTVRDGVGTIQLQAISITGKSAFNGVKMRGRVKTMKYMDGDEFINVESNGSIFTFPANVLQFVAVGAGVGSVFHGSVCLKMVCTVGVVHMPVSTAIFTMMM